MFQFVTHAKPGLSPLVRPPLVPRWYQEEARDAIWHYFNDGGEGNPVVAMPTGTGKSVVIGDFVRQMVTHYPGLRIIKLTHVKELIEQNFAKLTELWPLAPAGIYSAGLGRRDHRYPITYAGIASVAKKAHLFGHIDFVLIDEAHTLGPKDGTNYRVFIEGLRRTNPLLKVIGFTATPYRLGQGLITEDGLFTDVCYDLTTFDSFARLIAEGHMCPLIARRPQHELDVSGVKMSAGDYNLHDLQLTVDRKEITARALDYLLGQANDRGHWLIFASGVEHSNHIAEALEARGVSAVSIHSKMGDDERDWKLNEWKSGRITAAVNNNVLTTGIDFPQIDLIGVLRPTTSTGLWVQMLGRGTRPAPGKRDCLVLDFAGNTARLGPINDPVIPSKKKKKGKGAAPVKCCPTCSTWNHASVRFCVSCGEEFVAHVKFSERASEIEVLAGEEPKVVTFAVDSVSYDVWHSRNRQAHKPDTLKVTYYAGLRQFSEWIGLESSSHYARHKARDWWRARSTDAPPDTVQEAWQRFNELATPTHIRVWINHEPPEVMLHDFTGEGFPDCKE